MEKGIYLISADKFFELKDKLIIGKGPGADIILEGELAPQQVQIFVFDNHPLVVNLDASLTVSVGKKILPEGWNLPLFNWSLIEVGDIQFIYSEEGAPRPFQIKKILEGFELVGASEFDKALLEKGTEIKVKVTELTKKIKPYISEMEKIKNEIASLIKERDKKTQEYNLHIEKITHEYHSQIEVKKTKFDQLKAENTKLIDELKITREKGFKILKEAAETVATGKLELDK